MVSDSRCMEGRDMGLLRRLLLVNNESRYVNHYWIDSLSYPEPGKAEPSLPQRKTRKLEWHLSSVHGKCNLSRRSKQGMDRNLGDLT